ncbi:MAG: hypothetical protein ACE5JP_00195 [Candidatus Bipolaricaulia bacterium]
MYPWGFIDLDLIEAALENVQLDWERKKRFWTMFMVIRKLEKIFKLKQD